MTDHHAEYALLTAAANAHDVFAWGFRERRDYRRAMLHATMAHAKRLQAKWHHARIPYTFAMTGEIPHGTRIEGGAGGSGGRNFGGNGGRGGGAEPRYEVITVRIEK